MVFSVIVLMHITCVFDFRNPKYVANIFKRWEFRLTVNIPGNQLYVSKTWTFSIIKSFGDFKEN